MKTKRDFIYSPMAVLREWRKIEWGTPLGFAKIVAGVLLFTALFTGYLAVCEMLAVWLITL